MSELIRTAQHLLEWAFVVLASVVALAWLVQLLLALRIARSVPPLSRLEGVAPRAWPRLTMVVPARDEAGAVEAALESKLACGYPELEVVAIDDRSQDGTGEIIDRVGSTDPRVRVVHIDLLPEGWLGKLHAMKKGLEFASGEWILFSDADVHVESGTLERLIAHAEAESIDFISVFPGVRRVNLLVDSAICALLRLILLTGRVWSANDDRSHVGTGIGAFNLVRRRILEKTRAIDELRMEVADDVALAALVKQSGARARFFAGRSKVHMVLADSLAAGARSTDKSGGFLGFSLLRVVGVVVAGLGFDLVVPIVGLTFSGIAPWIGGAALLLATATHVLLIAHFAGPIAGAFAWPIGYVLDMAMMLRAGILAWRHQGIYWRGTFYPRRVLEEGKRLQLPSLRVDLTAERR